MRNGRERWLLKLGDEYVGIYNFILTTLVKYDIFYDKRVFFFFQVMAYQSCFWVPGGTDRQEY